METTEQSDGQKMVKAFRFVRDVYRNVSWMLLSCDQLMNENGFLPTDDKRSIWPKTRPELAQGNISDTWLPYFVVRKYRNYVDQCVDLITLGAVVWDNYRTDFDTPLCLASRMLSAPAADTLDWFSDITNTAGRPFGEVQVLGSQHVRGGRLFSLACPLLEISNEGDIEKRLINPLLARCLTELVPLRSEDEEVRWLLQAAKHWSSAAIGSCRPEEVSWQVNLGVKYLNGQGVPQDNAEAVRWFREAAEKGHHPLGQSNLGTMYRDGKGVERNDAEAVRWFREAAQQGDPNGQANLGFMYEMGLGVGAKNRDYAIKCYRKAAEKLEHAKKELKRLGIEL